MCYLLIHLKWILFLLIPLYFLVLSIAARLFRCGIITKKFSAQLQVDLITLYCPAFLLEEQSKVIITQHFFQFPDIRSEHIPNPVTLTLTKLDNVILLLLYIYMV